MAIRLIGTRLTDYRTTDHRREIRALRERARAGDPDSLETYALAAAAELLAAHDETGISLDGWTEPRALVEMLLEHPILPNHA